MADSVMPVNTIVARGILDDSGPTDADTSGGAELVFTRFEWTDGYYGVGWQAGIGGLGIIDTDTDEKRFRDGNIREQSNKFSSFMMHAGPAATAGFEYVRGVLALPLRYRSTDMSHRIRDTRLSDEPVEVDGASASTLSLNPEITGQLVTGNPGLVIGWGAALVIPLKQSGEQRGAQPTFSLNEDVGWQLTWSMGAAF